MNCNFGRSNISCSILCIVFRKGQGSEHLGGPNIAQEYSFAEVIAMTNKFNQILGEGGFGTVLWKTAQWSRGGCQKVIRRFTTRGSRVLQ
jgi:hypothetical protein